MKWALNTQFSSQFLTFGYTYRLGQEPSIFMDDFNSTLDLLGALLKVSFYLMLFPAD